MVVVSGYCYGLEKSSIVYIKYIFLMNLFIKKAFWKNLLSIIYDTYVL